MFGNTNTLSHNMLMSNKKISMKFNSEEKQLPSITIIAKERDRNVVVYPEIIFHTLPVQTVSDQEN